MVDVTFSNDCYREQWWQCVTYPLLPWLLQPLTLNKHYWVCKHTWYHLVSSSASGFLKNPPTSAPLSVMPTRFSDSSIGSDALRWDQSPVLSPVHTAPTHRINVISLYWNKWQMLYMYSNGKHCKSKCNMQCHHMLAGKLICNRLIDWLSKA